MNAIDLRCDALKRYWVAFDAIHRKQKSGMKSLWGLVADHRSLCLIEDPEVYSPSTPFATARLYQLELYESMLPQDLLKDVATLWCRCMLVSWPDRMVTEPFPHAGLAETFGPALSFWHGCALTAWFILEGPYSRTNLPGMEKYYSAPLAELERMNTPVDRRLFRELAKAGVELALPKPIGTRRRGFKVLRDIIAINRRSWAEKYLDEYVRCRWQSEIESAAKSYNVILSGKGGKPPTVKQFAKSALLPTNNWFGGDVSSLYEMICGESPIQPEYRSLMPSDRGRFAKEVFYRLGGQPFKSDPVRNHAEYDKFTGLLRLAEDSVRYVQLEEAIGRPPILKEYGPKKFEYWSQFLAGDINAAWARYGRAIAEAKDLNSRHVD